MKSRISRISIVLVATLLIFSCATPAFDLTTDQTAVLSIIPEPNSIQLGTGTFALTSATGLEASEELASVAALIKSDIKEATGFDLAGTENKISLVLDPAYKAKNEGYKLDVTTDLVTITANEAAGIFYGYQTLKQMMPAYVYAKMSTAKKAVEIPCAFIIDEPRFAWRGLMVDDCRHFVGGVENMKRFLDTMAVHKLNTMQWHLTEDQGWRIEIKAFPKLTEVGAWRTETKKGLYWDDEFAFDGVPHGGFYTQEEVKEIVAYAQERFITIVPEIEMPGHAQAAIAAYPELGNNPDKQLPVFTNWGVNPTVLNVNDNTIEFLKTVLDEVMELFPSTYIHIGADECPKTEWENSADAQARIKELGLVDDPKYAPNSHTAEEKLQSWFVGIFDEYLASHGRKLIGWDEILEGGLTDGATVMSWRGEEHGITAANLGHDVVMTPTTFVYLDYLQAPQKTEPLSIGGNLPLKHVYSWNPLPSKIAPDKAHHVIGGQGNLWSEYMKDIEQVYYMAYPRAASVAESTWSQNEDKNYSKFCYKLQKHYQRLAQAGIPFRYPDNNKYTVPINFTSGECEIDLKPSCSGFYQIFINKTNGPEVKISKVELLVNGEVVDTQERLGTTCKTFSQSTVYTLSACKKACPKAEAESTVTAKVYYSASSPAKAKVIVKTL